MVEQGLITEVAKRHTAADDQRRRYYRLRRFTFKTNGTAHVTCKIYRGNKEVFQRPQNRERAGSPFTVSWESQGQPEGEYRLALSGYFDDNTQLAKEVIFYHRASWK